MPLYYRAAKFCRSLLLLSLSLSQVVLNWRAPLASHTRWEDHTHTQIHMNKVLLPCSHPSRSTFPARLRPECKRRFLALSLFGSQRFSLPLPLLLPYSLTHRTIFSSLLERQRGVHPRCRCGLDRCSGEGEVKIRPGTCACKGQAALGVEKRREALLTWLSN